MTAEDNWISNPHRVIQQCFDEDKACFDVKVKSYFEQHSKLEKNKIPSINDVALHSLHNHMLVRYRCMVQDMFDPEFYLGLYEVKMKDGSSKMVNGKYKDLAGIDVGEEILLDSSLNVTMDRSTLYCVPIPGEQTWVRMGYSQRNVFNGNSAAASSSAAIRPKRSRDDDTPHEKAVDEVPNAVHLDLSMETENNNRPAENKKSKSCEKAGTGQVTSSPNLNFPLPNEGGTSCIVKIYDKDFSCKVTDVFEFIGVLSNDPSMVSFPENQPGSVTGVQDSINACGDLMDGIEEQNTRSPPPSLVPRLHVILAKKLSHNNPNLADNISETLEKGQKFIEEALETRKQLLSLLTSACLGDPLTAEYLLCHLLSNVYAREDVMALGKFALNICGCPRSTSYVKLLYELLSTLITKSFLLEMSLDNMNKLKFSPAKDYKANRLTSGILQLSEQTQLVVDETAMSTGQLDTTGVQNITALGNVIRWQKVEYDFTYHKQDFTSNLNVLVVSEGKSLLPCDALIKLIPTSSTEKLEETFSALHKLLEESDLLTNMRNYITIVKSLSYSITPDVQEVIQEDFVKMRREDSKAVTVDSFHQSLVLARIICLSSGNTTLTKDMWEATKDLELRRNLRMSDSMTAARA